MRTLISLAAAMLLSTNLFAGFSGSALLSTENVLITIQGQGTATASFDPLEDQIDFTIGSSVTTYTNTATLDGSTSVKQGTQSLGWESDFSQTKISYSGDFTIGAIGPVQIAETIDAVETTGVGNVATASSLFGGAFADVTGDSFYAEVSGKPSTLLNPDPYPAPAVGGTGVVSADLVVEEPGIFGSANGNIVNSSLTVSLSALNDAVIDISFDALVGLALSNDDPLLEPIVGTASSNLILQINGSNSTGAQTMSAEVVFSELNQTISLGDAPYDFDNSLTTNGRWVATGANIVGGGLELIEGFTYEFTINQTANVELSNVPEPGTLSVFGMFMFVAGIRRRRR